MKKYVLLLTAVTACMSCIHQTTSVAPLPSDEISIFTSTDKVLEEGAQWAKAQALAYAHDGSDSVGYWYEAALPSREAFCMRDVAHQSVGAQIIGLKAHNSNMLRKFAQNISESKDWCSYWEINRYDRPAPVDYANDKDFWYNLNANFDITYACMKMYEWTGDKAYLCDQDFTDFYTHTFDQYVDHWMLDPDHVMERPLHMHVPQPFDPNNRFQSCRGLPSYVESFSGMTMSLDLVSSLYIGHQTYADMLTLTGHAEQAAGYAAKAEAYRQLMDTRWWQADSCYYNTYYTADQTFYKGEGVTFALWYDAVKDAERIRRSIADLLSHTWNVENLSYFPALLYRYGYDQPAYDLLLQLRSHRRNAYPEVSYAWMEALVCGYMGLLPQASTGSVSTLLRAVGDDTAEVRNVPLWKGYITLRHNGHSESVLTNHTGQKLLWNAQFKGHYQQAEVNGKPHAVSHTTDRMGQEYTIVSIKLSSGQTHTVKAIE